MRTLVLTIVFLSFVRMCESRYKPYFAIPGTTTRITCMDHVKKLDEMAGNFYYKWFINGTAFNYSEHNDKWLDDETRTMVIDDTSQLNLGRYKCRCYSRRTQKPCTKRRRKGKRRIPMVQKTLLLLEPMVKSGICEWRDNSMNALEKVSYLKQKYSFECSCDIDHTCGQDMKMQRQDWDTGEWHDVEFGRRYGAITFYFFPNQMTITGQGSNLTYEQSGLHRCVGYDSQGILCESMARHIEHDFLPVPRPVAEFAYRKHLITYGLPIAGSVFGVILFTLVAMMIYYKCTRRVVIQAKNSKLIGRITDPDPQEDLFGDPVPPVLSDTSSSSLYPQLETVTTIA